MGMGYQIFRWTARIYSALIIALVITFFIGEGIYEGFSISELDLQELLLMFCFPFGVVAGFLIAWRSEIRGGLLAVMSTGIFYLLNYYFQRSWPDGPWFAIFTLPGFIFMLAGAMKPASYQPSIRFPDE